MSLDDGTIRRRPNYSEDDYTERAMAERDPRKVPGAAADLEAGADKASPALRPHWQVLLGARLFREGDSRSRRKSFPPS